MKRSHHRKPFRLLGEPASRHRQSGLTLLETAFYLAILAIISAPVVSSVLVGTQAVAETDAVSRVQERSRSTLDRLASAVRQSVGGTLLVGDDFLEFNLAEGFDGSNLVPGDRIRFEIEPEPSDPRNGHDDNGNGLVDEGRLVRTNLEEGERVAVCGGVDVDASGFAPAGGGVTITLTNAGSARRGAPSVRLMRAVTVFPRN